MNMKRQCCNNSYRRHRYSIARRLSRFVSAIVLFFTMTVARNAGAIEAGNTSTTVIPDFAQTGIINVKDFMAGGGLIPARGDGKTDDTAAIQAAANLADKKRVSFKPPLGTYTGSSPVLYFPSGHYIISDEIRVGAYATVASEGGAVIEQRTTGKRILVFNDAYEVNVRGLKFVNGSNQIFVSNRNLDGTMIGIENCVFQTSSDYAIDSEGTLSATDRHMSANMRIVGCKFINPRKVLRNVCDYAMVRDTWISLSLKNFDADSAAFLNRSGILMLDNMSGVPSFGLETKNGGHSLVNNGVDRVRWVDNYGSFMATRCRFGGEFGGIPIIHHFGAPSPGFPWMGQTVDIQNSWLCAGPGRLRPDSGVLTLRTGIPQLIRITGNNWLVDSPFIRSADFDIAKFLSQYPNARERFKILIGPNIAYPSQPAIPAELEPYVYPASHGD